jgi:DNA-binding response OmpR family regulator
MSRILIVEDDPAIGMALEDDLRLEGYIVELVMDGEQAIARARESTFDLVLLDVMLPRKDGFDVCRELRRSGVDSKIVLLTPHRRNGQSSRPRSRRRRLRHEAV